MAKKAKGFTLVEILLAGIVFAFLGMAAGSLFYMHGKMIKAATESSQKNLETQAALLHMTNNIASSAWIKVLDVNTIELHSHSHQNLRTYLLRNGNLVYQDGNSSQILARGITASMLFIGTGDSKPTNRFQKVQIEFWNTDATGGTAYLNKDLFYTKVYAASREDWSIIYVDPSKVSAIQDGTKIFPFGTLAAALENALAGDAVVVLTGEHELSGDQAINCGYLYFAPGTSLTISAGASLRMGKNTAILTDGSFYCTGSAGNRISMTSMDPQSYSWGGITVRPTTRDNTVQTYFDFSYLDISYSSSGITVDPKWDDIALVVDISNNNSYNNGTAYRISGAKELNVFSNTFTNNSVSVILTDDASFAYTGTIKQYIYQNTFNGKAGLGYDYGVMLQSYARSGNPVIQEIYNNDFPEVQTPVSLNNGGDGIITSKVYNNKMYPEQYSAVDIMGNTNTNTATTLDIYNNIIDASRRQPSYGGCLYLGNNKPFSVTISNNDIRNSGNYSYAYGIEIVSMRDVTIKNNLIHNIQRWGIWVEPHNSNMNVLVKNNIMYGTSGSGSIFVWPMSSYYADMTLVNNTLFGSGTLYGSARWNVKNSILWGNMKMESYVQQKTAYSDVKDMNDAYINDTTKNIKIDPRLNPDYTLPTGSPGKNAGILHDDKGKPVLDNAGNAIPTDMGAHGGGYDPNIGIGPKAGTVGRTQ